MEAIKVKLIAATDAAPLELASHAALKCYQAEDPQWGKTIDVENRLFGVGHHTTLQHFFFTFSIEGIAVGDITFGLHLTHPFYNSDQRSGRYCAQMFLAPDFSAIEKYIHQFWPEVKGKDLKSVVGYVKRSVAVYHKNIAVAAEISRGFLQKERPYVSDKYLEATAPKIAQEQMRMFIPIIFPTGFDYTVNLTVLAAMHRTAWTPAMRSVVSEMVKAVTRKFPELKFMFSSETAATEKNDWAAVLPKKTALKMRKKPAHKLLEISGEKKFVFPRSEMMHPVDLMHFDPLLMDNSVGNMKTAIEISVATMGQDQRHRTIRRSVPNFTGAFYLPPILSKMKLEKEARELMEEWLRVSRKMPKTLAMLMAPYGAMVAYEKSGSFNAILHEQGKRLCWCAQEEIYHAGLELRRALEKRNKRSKLLPIFEPPCYRTGKCAEGGRYCGRDLKKRKSGDYFPNRKV